MRRLCSLVLLLLMALPLVAATYAGTRAADDGLPACCRRNGKHHCAMGMATAAASLRKLVFRQVPERCPYQLFHATAGHFELGLTASRKAHEPALPEVFRVREADGCRRVARERARHKRGPPTGAAAWRADLRG